MFWVVWSPSPHHWVLWSGIPFKRVLWERKALDSARGASAVGVVAASGLPPVALPGLVGPQTVQVEIHSNNRLLWNKQMLIASLSHFPPCSPSSCKIYVLVQHPDSLFVLTTGVSYFETTSHRCNISSQSGWLKGDLEVWWIVPKALHAPQQSGNWAADLSWVECTAHLIAAATALPD